MSRVLVTEQHLTAIAEAIRDKLDTEDTYRPGDMAAAIREISGYPEPTGTLPITANGAVNVKDYAAAAVNVQPNLQQKTVTQNGTVTADSGYDGLSSVAVNVSGGGEPYELLEYIDSNGTQGIDTGAPVPASANLRAEFLMISSPSEWYWGFGAQYQGTKYAGLQFGVPENKCQVHPGDGTLVNRGAIRYVGNAIVDATTFVTTNAASQANLWIFGLGRNNPDTPVTHLVQMRLYMFAVNDSIYLPCRRKSDGVCGLWDSHGGAFLTDSLNGDPFVAGPVIYPGEVEA